MERLYCWSCKQGFTVPDGVQNEEFPCPHCGANNFLGDDDAGELCLSSDCGRAINPNAITAKMNITEAQTLKLVKTYLKTAQWEDATALLDEVLTENPFCAEAIWLQMLANKKARSNGELMMLLPTFSNEEFQSLEKIFDFAPSELAEELLGMLYDSYQLVQDDMYCKVLTMILPFPYARREEKIKQAFAYAIERGYKETFALTLSMMEGVDQTQWIAYQLAFAGKLKSFAAKKKYAQAVLDVDNRNEEALKMLLNAQLTINNPSNEVVKTLERLLEVSRSAHEEIRQVFAWLAVNLDSRDDCKLIQTICETHSALLPQWEKELSALANKALVKAFFDEAEALARIVLSINENSADAYWIICLAKIHATTVQRVVDSDIPLKQVPEYTKYLTLVSEAQQMQCISLCKNQQNAIEERIAERKKAEEERIKKQKEEAAKRKKANTKRATCALIIAGIVALITFGAVDCSIRSGCTLTLSKDGTYYYVSNADYNLSEIIIPSTYYGKPVKTIGSNSFDEINKYNRIERVIIPDSVVTINKGAFEGCDSLQFVSIGDGVTTIGKSAFRWCRKLTTVVMGKSVTNIGEAAFQYCERLSTVYYKGTQEEWSKVYITTTWDGLLYATKYFYSETQPTESGNYWHYVDGTPTKWDPVVTE